MLVSIMFEEELRRSVPGRLPVAVRRGFLPPSCVFVGTIVVEVSLLPSVELWVSTASVAGSSRVFRFRFLTTCVETVAACSLTMT